MQCVTEGKGAATRYVTVKFQLKCVLKKNRKNRSKRHGATSQLDGALAKRGIRHLT